MRCVEVYDSACRDFPMAVEFQAGLNLIVNSHFWRKRQRDRASGPESDRPGHRVRIEYWSVTGIVKCEGATVSVDDAYSSSILGHFGFKLLLGYVS